MATNEDYIPREDAEFRTWAQTMSSRIALNPPLYMMTQAQADSIVDAVEQFNVAYLIANAEATRNKGTVLIKNSMRSIAETLCRQYAMLIKENDGISDDDKIYVGVRPVNPSREPIEVPNTSPVLNIVGNTPGSQTVTFADSLTPNNRAKPFGAAGLQLYLAITEDEDAPLSSAQLYKLCTRNPVGVEFSEANDGKVATYYGRWYSVRGDVGPWSLGVSMRIAA